MLNKYLIMPCAGLSTRYHSSKPKWLFTLPNNNYVIVNLIKNYSYIKPKKIYVIILKLHEKKFNASKLIFNQLDKNLKKLVEIIILDKITNGPADTVYQLLNKKQIKGQIYIKDCDSWYDLNKKIISGNFVSLGNLKNEKHIKRISEKSFATIDKHNKIISIVEKKITSNYFSAGMYAFSSALEYKKNFIDVRKISKQEIFVSHIIMHMILKGHVFTSEFVNNIIDLGTKEDWDNYFQSKSNIILTLDQILEIKNGSIKLIISKTQFHNIKKKIYLHSKKGNPIIFFNSFDNILLIKSFLNKFFPNQYQLVNNLNNSPYIYIKNNYTDRNNIIEEYIQ